MRGRLTTDQKIALKSYINDRIVEDLGAGNGELTRFCLSAGAARVIAVDGQLDYQVNYALPRCIGVRAYMHEYFAAFPKQRSDQHVALVSWPVVYGIDGLEDVCALFSRVIYLGKNDDGTACGSQSFWRGLLQREVLYCHEHHLNDLIVYGAVQTESKRTLLREERAAIEQHEAAARFLERHVML
jgi:hypothetical protein